MKIENSIKEEKKCGIDGVISSITITNTMVINLHPNEEPMKIYIDTPPDSKYVTQDYDGIIRCHTSTPYMLVRRLDWTSNSKLDEYYIDASQKVNEKNFRIANWRDKCYTQCVNIRFYLDRESGELLYEHID